MKTITFINEKGGIGKTSICFNTGWALSDKKKVLFIDLDGQRANLSFFCGVQKEDDMPTMFNILHEGKDISDAIIPIKKNLDIVPATNNTTNISQQAKITNFKKVLSTLDGQYDYVFIDVNPSPSWTHVLALSVSNYAIIPMLPDVASLEANKGVAETIDEIRETTNSKLEVLGIVFNQNENRTNLGKDVKEVAERVASQLGSTVFKTKIRSAVALKENVSMHMGITDYSPKSFAAEDYISFSKEVVKRIKEK